MRQAPLLSLAGELWSCLTQYTLEVFKFVRNRKRMAVELGDDELDNRSRKAIRTTMDTSARRSDDRDRTPRRRLSDGDAGPAPRRNFGTSFSLVSQDTPTESHAIMDDGDKENVPVTFLGGHKFEIFGFKIG